MYIYLGCLQRLQTLDVLCLESRLSDVIDMLRSIMTPTFQQISIYVPLTSFDLSFASLNALNIAVHQGRLLSDPHVNIYLLSTNISQQDDLKTVYGGVIQGRLFRVQELGRLTVNWFFDDDFACKFRACPGKRLFQSKFCSLLILYQYGTAPMINMKKNIQMSQWIQLLEHHVLTDKCTLRA